MPDAIMTSAEAPAEPSVIVHGPRQRSAQWGDLMTALAKAQGEIEGAKKDSEAVVTGTTKRKYADLASVWSAIRAPLAKNGVAVMQWPRVTDRGVEIETIVAHGEQFISDVLWMPCAQMNAHGIGSAITYGRRYALMAVAGVAPEDDDGDGAMDRSGVSGSAGGGSDYRPPGPRRQSSWGDGGKQGAIAEAQRDGLMDAHGHPHKAAEAERGNPPSAPVRAGPLGGREATAEEARAVKIKNAVDKRIDALKSAPFWTRDSLDQFWAGNKEWIDWMTDPNNKALKEYERFTNAFADAEVNAKPVELA